MAEFSILTRDGDRAPSKILGRKSPKLGEEPAAERDSPAQNGPRLADPGEHLAPPSPKVVVRLPDVGALEMVAPTRRITVGSIAYWTCIALGTALAVALIWTPQRAPVVPVDEAPAWTPPSSVHGEGSALPFDRFGSSRSSTAPAAPPLTQEPAMSQETGMAQDPRNAILTAQPADMPPADPGSQPAQQPTGDGNLPPEGPVIRNGSGLPQHPAYPGAPSHGGGVVNAGPQREEVRTANRPPMPPDDRSNPSQPGSAAPLGITTPVQR